MNLRFLAVTAALFRQARCQEDKAGLSLSGHSLLKFQFGLVTRLRGIR
jgi:hypothetical protein